MHLSSSNLKSWTYRRSPFYVFSEIATVHGNVVALPPHFHDEDQWVYVVIGRRRFIINGNIIEIKEGEWICIPSGLLHSSLSEECLIFCFNFYIASHTHNIGLLQKKIKDFFLIEIKDSKVVNNLSLKSKQQIKKLYNQPELGRLATIEKSAHIAGMSREYFSRYFHKKYGVTPEKYRLLLRLNHARKNLKYNLPLSQVAAEAGFADQSHLGRAFKKFFGVTPKEYKAN